MLIIRNALLLALLAVTACSDPLGPEEDAFQVARARWAAARVSSYTYDLQRLCFCGQEYTSVVSIVVEDDEIVSATYRDSGDPFTDPFTELYTVDDLFNEILDAIRREAYSLNVEYDPVLGYPTDIAIDYSLNIADEERSYRVTAFDSGEG